MKHNLKRIQRLYAEGQMSLERAQKAVTSYTGLLSHCDSWQLTQSIFGENGWFKLQRNSDKIDKDSTL